MLQRWVSAVLVTPPPTSHYSLLVYLAHDTCSFRIPVRLSAATAAARRSAVASSLGWREGGGGWRRRMEGKPVLPGAAGLTFSLLETSRTRRRVGRPIL